MMNQNFEPTTLSFENISYTVGEKDTRVLNNIFGIAKPRECLAIMGGSGAGKTTLLDILAERIKMVKFQETYMSMVTSLISNITKKLLVS